MPNANLDDVTRQARVDEAESPKYGRPGRAAVERQQVSERSHAAPGSHAQRTERWPVWRTLLIAGAVSLALWGLIAGLIFAVTR